MPTATKQRETPRMIAFCKGAKSDHIALQFCAQQISPNLWKINFSKALFFLDRDPILLDLDRISLLKQRDGLWKREGKGNGYCRSIAFAQRQWDFTRLEITSNIKRFRRGRNSYREKNAEAHFDRIDAGDLFPSYSEWTPERIKTAYSLIVNQEKKRGSKHLKEENEQTQAEKEEHS